MICFSLITYYKKYWENSLWIYRWFYFYGDFYKLNP